MSQLICQVTCACVAAGPFPYSATQLINEIHIFHSETLAFQWVRSQRPNDLHTHPVASHVSQNLKDTK